MRLVLLAAIVACLVLVLYALARSIGLGVCKECGARCPPWSVYCSRHNPFYTPRDDPKWHSNNDNDRDKG
jgi:hypothetical protein